MMVNALLPHAIGRFSVRRKAARAIAGKVVFAFPSEIASHAFDERPDGAPRRRKWT
jgi:hypothetical protein